MSQSRFSIVLVGVSALLRRPLVSRLRPADGERSPWVVFAVRRCLPFRRLPLGGLAFGLTTSAFRHAPLRRLPLGELAFGLRFPLFGMHHFGVAARRVGSSAFRFGVAARRIDLRAHDFRFSACAASGLPLGGLVLLPSASGLPLGGLVLLPSASEMAARRVGLRAHDFRFRHAPLRSCPRWVGLRAHGFRFSARTASGLPSASWRFCSAGWFFCLPLRRLPLGGLTFGLTASAFRHAPLRRLPSAGWPSGSRLSLFGMRRSAPPCRRREGRWSAPTRHLFHFKTLISTC